MNIGSQTVEVIAYVGPYVIGYCLRANTPQVLGFEGNAHYLTTEIQSSGLTAHLIPGYLNQKLSNSLHQRAFCCPYRATVCSVPLLILGVCFLINSSDQ